MPSQVSITETPRLDAIGPYHIIKKIGEGAMAAVYRAEKKGLGDFSKRVALKVVVPELATKPNFVRWFNHEAQLGSYLSHPNIVETLDFGEYDEHLFLAMEYIDGPTLRQLLNRYIQRKDPLPWDVALTLLIGVLRGLAYAHKATDYQGQALCLIHRDLKPSNILIDRFGQARLADFGVATSDGDSDGIQSGVIKGTLRYMSPEQAWGQQNLDNRSDIFSIGLILYEVLTMEALYPDGDQAEVLPIAQAADVEAALENLPDLPCRDEILPIIRRCLAKDVEARYASADLVRQDLRAILQKHQKAPDMGSWIEGVGWRHLGLSDGHPSASSKTSLAPGAASLTSMMELEDDDGQPSTIPLPLGLVNLQNDDDIALPQAHSAGAGSVQSIELPSAPNLAVTEAEPAQREGQRSGMMLILGLLLGAAVMGLFTIFSGDGEKGGSAPATAQAPIAGAPASGVDGTEIGADGAEKASSGDASEVGGEAKTQGAAPSSKSPGKSEAKSTGKKPSDGGSSSATKTATDKTGAKSASEPSKDRASSDKGPKTTEKAASDDVKATSTTEKVAAAPEPGEKKAPDDASSTSDPTIAVLGQPWNDGADQDPRETQGGDEKEASQKAAKQEAVAQVMPSQLFLSASRDAALYLDNQLLRTLTDPRPIRGHEIQPGTHQISALFENGKRLNITVLVKDGMELRCIADPNAAETGKIQCRQAPPRKRRSGGQ